MAFIYSWRELMNMSVMFFMAFFSFHSCSGGLTMTFKSEEACRSDLQNAVTVKYERSANITCCLECLSLSCRFELKQPLCGFNGRSPMRLSVEGETGAQFLRFHSGRRVCANSGLPPGRVSVTPGGVGATPLAHAPTTQVLHWPHCVPPSC